MIIILLIRSTINKYDIIEDTTITHWIATVYYYATRSTSKYECKVKFLKQKRETSSSTTYNNDSNTKKHNTNAHQPYSNSIVGIQRARKMNLLSNFVGGGSRTMSATTALFAIAACQSLTSINALIDCSSAVVGRIVDGSSDSDLCSYFGSGVDAEVYIDWYNDQSIEATYPNHVFLQGSDPTEPDNGVAVHWSVDDKHVYLAVAAPATGWVGFGLAEAGGMLGADMVIFEASNPSVLIDAYTTTEKYPIVDDCASNWEVLDTKSENGFLFFETRRLLDTGDPQDRAIINDGSSLTPTHRVIAAWGDSESYEYHGLNRARGSIRFFGTGSNQSLFESAMNQHAEGSFTVQSLNHQVAARETQYAYTCVTRSDIIEQGFPDTNDKAYLIGFEPFVQPGNEAYVHHYIISAFDSVNCVSLIDDRLPGEMVYGWAPGTQALALPDFLGFPFNGVGEANSFQIEVHYNNVALDEGVIDSSGVSFHWTTAPREVEMGIFQTGDPFVSLNSDPVGNGITKHTFDCPSSCSQDAFGGLDVPVTVFGESLHMHQTGVQMINEQIRSGEVVHSATVGYWDFDQSGSDTVVQEAFVVEPGDSFRTSCYYETNDDTRFGIGSQEEMCIAFLVYYPRVKMQLFGGFVQLPWVCGHDIPLEHCEATYEKDILASSAELGRTFGIPVGECPVVDQESPTSPPQEDNDGETDGIDGETDDADGIGDGTDEDVNQENDQSLDGEAEEVLFEANSANEGTSGSDAARSARILLGSVSAIFALILVL